MFYTIKVCDSKAAYEVIPGRQEKLDLNAAAEILKKAGFEVLIQTRVLVIVEKVKKIHIYSTGKLLVEDASVEETDKIAQEIYELIGFESAKAKEKK